MKDETPFVDTNILVYAFDKSEPEKNRKASRLLQQCFQGETMLAVSTQILSEFFVTVTKKIPKPMACEDAKQIVQKIIEFGGFVVLGIKPGTVVSAISTCSETKAHYWDTLIAETMKENKMFTILTENMEDFKKIKEIKAVNPLQ